MPLIPLLRHLILLAKVLRIAGHPHQHKRGSSIDISTVVDATDLSHEDDDLEDHCTKQQKEWRWVCSDCSTKIQVAAQRQLLR